MNLALSRSSAYTLTLFAPLWLSSPGCKSSNDTPDTPKSGVGGAGTSNTGGTSTGGLAAPASGGRSTGGNNTGGMLMSSGGSTGGSAAQTGGAAQGGMAGGGSGKASGGSSGGNAGASAGSGGTSSGGASAGTAGNAGSGGGAPKGSTFVYVSGSGGPNITRFALDVAAGTLTSKGTIGAGNQPTYLAISPSGKNLYAVNETSPSKVVAFSIGAEGALTEINSQETTGNGGPHIAVHPSGKFVVVPHYGSGHVTVLPVRDDGGVGGAVATSRGPNDGCQKAHQAVFDSTGEQLFVPCLGSNYVMQFTFPDSGMIALNTPPTVTVQGGPRHMALHPTAPFAYVLNELNSTLTQLSYDRETGLLSDPVVISSVQTSPGASAHVVIHPSGNFLYASNRTENSLGLFSLNATTGAASPVAFEKSMVSTPRDFAVDPSGQILIVANQDGQQDLLVYRIASDGALTKLANVAVGSRPSVVAIVNLP